MKIHSSNGITFQTVEDGDILLQALALRHDAYLEAEYIEKAYPDNIIHDKRDESSTHIVALDDECVIGTIRLAEPPFDTLVVWKNNLFIQAEELIKLAINSKSVELSALAVKKGTPLKKVAWGLYKATYLLSCLKEINYWVIGVDIRVLRALRILGWHMREVAFPAKYMGSICVPCIMPVAKQLESIADKNPRYYRYLTSET